MSPNCNLQRGHSRFDNMILPQHRIVISLSITEPKVAISGLDAVKDFTVKLELYIDVCESFSAKDFAVYQPFSAFACKPKGFGCALILGKRFRAATELYKDVCEGAVHRKSLPRRRVQTEAAFRTAL